MQDFFLMRSKSLFQLPTTAKGHILLNEYQQTIMYFVLSSANRPFHMISINFLGEVIVVGREGPKLSPEELQNSILRYQIRFQQGQHTSDIMY